jgi:hypothetical protein
VIFGGVKNWLVGCGRPEAGSNVKIVDGFEGNPENEFTPPELNP